MPALRLSLLRALPELRRIYRHERPQPDGQGHLPALLAAGFRASLDHRPEKINAKIRDAQLEKIPVMFVVGAKEAANQAVAYRDRLAGDLGAMPLAQAMARLNHPHIVAVHDFGDVEGLYYLVMEYVEGVNLRQALAEGKLAA